MPLVVDASFAAGWFLPDEVSVEADAIARRLTTDRGLVPSLFKHELRNLLLTAHRRGRLSSDALFSQLSNLERFPLVDCGPGNSAEIVRLAIAHSLSAYDAAYLALALRERAPLATRDRALAAAAKDAGASLIGS
jgi:predicted nucleic acid-binding protein